MSYAVRDMVSLGYMTAAGTVTLYHPGSGVAIPFELRTRGFSFNSPTMLKRLAAGEVTLRHRSATVTATAKGDRAMTDVTLFTGLTYSQFAWDITGKAAWSHSGATFNDADRQDYAPYSLVYAGITLPTAGITLDETQTHARLVNPQIVAAWCQVKVTSSTGTVAVAAVTLTASEHSFAKRV
jgi:hypothetical protein